MAGRFVRRGRTAGVQENATYQMMKKKQGYNTIPPGLSI